jgi:hypothetical protein
MIGSRMDYCRGSSAVKTRNQGAGMILDLSFVVSDGWPAIEQVRDGFQALTVHPATGMSKALGN